MEITKIKVNAVGLNYPMLKRSNYTAWSLKVQAHGVWSAVEPKSAKATIEEKTDKMTLAPIYQSIPEEMLLTIADKQTAKEAWDTLKTLCLRADRVKKFLQITSAIEQFGDIEKMIVDETIGSLKAREERLRGQTEARGGKLLLTEDEWLKRENNEGHLLLTKEEWTMRSKKMGTDVSQGQRNRGSSLYNPREGGRGGRDRNKVRSFNCNILGHYTAECRKS
ncbi:uncharacterized protein LOC141679903 [Apium graveolens]|uniref:uncharacterized protein LOC141679903 n=1 Tax=Apium graveolens TaxID=4045 RepID=UPI003D7A0914